MNKTGLCVIAIFCLLSFSYGIYNEVINIKRSEVEMLNSAEEHKRSLAEYTKSLENILNSENDSKIKNRSGHVSNFEGPQLSISYISHHGKEWRKEEQPFYIFDNGNVTFDPDLAEYGLPDFKVELSQPRFISPVENGVLERNIDAVKKYLPGISDIQPVKTYTKTFKDKGGRYRKEKFDLYLTEFEITIGVKPLRSKPKIKLTSAEKKEKRFPRYWYQHNMFETSSALVSLNDLDDIREYKNQRYSQIFVVFKIDPNNSAWYIDDDMGQQSKASVAIGSIVTKSISSNMKLKEYREAHISPGSPGVNVDMFLDDPTIGDKFKSVSILQDKPENIDGSIFNKDVYFRISSHNIGSWDKKVFFGEEWDDQFKIKFFMPILVKGKFEVAIDPNLIPEYKSEDAYYNSLSFNDIIPEWDLGEVGKIISYLLLGFSLVIAVMFLPNVFLLANSIIGFIAKLIKP